MTLETIYLLGEIGIFSFLIYYLYLGITKRYFSIIPIILGGVAWFLSSLTYHEIIKLVSSFQAVSQQASVDVIGSSTIMLSINSYILMLILLLEGVYIVTYIVVKVVEGIKKVRKK